MIHIEKLVNELMSSNCYIVWDDIAKGSIIIDPASEQSQGEIEFIRSHGLSLDYIILTHEHTDHTWGVNSLLDLYDAKVVCSEKCKENLKESGNAYFRLYYERQDYSYAVKRVDYTTENLNNLLKWNTYEIKFISTPGHSLGSICIDIDDQLFSGDTIMQYKPYINKRNGNKEMFLQSIEKIITEYSANTMVYPGHGTNFLLKDRYIIK